MLEVVTFSVKAGEADGDDRTAIAQIFRKWYNLEARVKGLGGSESSNE